MQRNFENYENYKEEVEKVGIKFFNTILADNYDYCILYDELIFGLYLLVQSKIVNSNNIPIYSSTMADSISIDFKNKSVLLLVNSVSDLNSWADVRTFIDRLEHKHRYIKLTVKILMVNNEIADKLQLKSENAHKVRMPTQSDSSVDCKESIDKFNAADNIAVISTPEFNFSCCDLLNSTDINDIFQSLNNNSTFTSMFYILFSSIFETDFMLNTDKETVIFTDTILYLVLLHFIENGTILNQKNKHIILCTEIETDYSKKIILESTVISIVSPDKTKNTGTIEHIKNKIKNINPKLAECDFYEEDLVHF